MACERRAPQAHKDFQHGPKGGWKSFRPAKKVAAVSPQPFLPTERGRSLWQERIMRNAHSCCIRSFTRSRLFESCTQICKPTSLDWHRNRDCKPDARLVIVTAELALTTTAASVHPNRHLTQSRSHR